ncbi:MAG: hypothetical protein SGARI_005927, partial [Bacillariaceae sp.]
VTADYDDYIIEYLEDVAITFADKENRDVDQLTDEDGDAIDSALTYLDGGNSNKYTLDHFFPSSRFLSSGEKAFVITGRAVVTYDNGGDGDGDSDSGGDEGDGGGSIGDPCMIKDCDEPVEIDPCQRQPTLCGGPERRRLQQDGVRPFELVGVLAPLEGNSAGSIVGNIAIGAALVVASVVAAVAWLKYFRPRRAAAAAKTVEVVEVFEETSKDDTVVDVEK